MLGGLSPAHLLIIMVIALIVVGPGKLPEVGAAIGRSLREFQKATGGITESLTGAMTQQAPPSQAAAQPPAQPGYPAPASQPQPGYPAPAQPLPMQYYPVMGVVEPAPVAPAQPAPAGYPQPDPSVQQPPSPPTAG